MKTLPLFVAAAASLLAVSGLYAQTAQTTRSSRTSRATITSRDTARLNAQRQAAARAAATASRSTAPRVDGGLVRAVRGGNPLQMVNPAAPAEYGDGRDVTRHEVDDPSQRPQGLRLFAVEF